MDIDEMVIDQTYRAHGRAAAYQPPSGDLVEDISICFHEPPADRDSGGVRINDLGVADKALTLLVRRAEVALPERGGVFTLTGSGAQLLLGEVVAHDAEGREWRCRYASAG